MQVGSQRSLLGLRWGSQNTAQLSRGGSQGWPRQGSGRPENPPRRSSCTPHPQVAGTWYSVAMAASDIALLNTQSAPLRVYVKELRLIPKDNLEIVLNRWWVSRAKPRRPGSRAGGGQGS